MYKHLSEQYERNVFLTEKKKSVEKPKHPKFTKQHTVKGKVKPGKSFEEDEDLLAGFKKSGPTHARGVMTPKKLKTDESIGYSKFDSIFRRTLSEDIEQDFNNNDAPTSSSPNFPPANSSNQSAHEEGDEEGGEESESDIIADLQDVVGKLNDILQSLGASSEDGDEEEEESEEVNDDIDNVEGKSADEQSIEQGVTESLKDLKSAIHGLKTKLSTLTGKQNKVSTSLKTTKGKAVASEHSGKPLSHNNSLQSRSGQKVNGKLKVGGSLFERRRSR